MTWFDWTLVSFLALNALGDVAMIGDPRRPVTKHMAMLGVINAALLIWGVVATRS